MKPYEWVDELGLFRDKTVLITGHTGFKGSWLCLWLNHLGARVHGFSDQIPTVPSTFEAARVDELLVSDLRGDLADLSAVDAAVRKIRPDFIFHLAAQPLVRLSYRLPVETFRTNVMGSIHVLEALRNSGHPCTVVCITTDKCYQNQEQTWGYRENDPMGGYDPYSASKGCAELAIASYRQSFFSVDRIAEHQVRLASARAGNVIGGGDWSADRIVVDILSNLAANQSIPVRNPHAIRPWQHVLEPLSGYLMLAAKMAGEQGARYCRAWNFGPLPGEEVTVGELATLFCRAWGEGAAWRDVSDPAAPHEAKTLRLCIDQALAELNWRPRWTVEEAVTRITDWQKAYARREDMRNICRNEICAYMGQA